jgi:hypothetical protein
MGFEWFDWWSFVLGIWAGYGNLVLVTWISEHLKRG